MSKSTEELCKEFAETAETIISVYALPFAQIVYASIGDDVYRDARQKLKQAIVHALEDAWMQ